jgi:hypothetical protein
MKLMSMLFIIALLFFIIVQIQFNRYGKFKRLEAKSVYFHNIGERDSSRIYMDSAFLFLTPFK